MVSQQVSFVERSSEGLFPLSEVPLHCIYLYYVSCCYYYREGDKLIVSGAVVLKEQFFKYTGRKLDFIWEEAGVSLHFPAATLRKSIDMSVVVVANVTDHSIFPRKYRFMPAASATYKITASAYYLFL